jgi:hypothetical protein
MLISVTVHAAHVRDPLGNTSDTHDDWELATMRI